MVGNMVCELIIHDICKITWEMYLKSIKKILHTVFFFIILLTSDD